MRPEDYPPQEPLSGIGLKYHEEVMARGEGIEGIDIPVGKDPYQSIAVYPSEKPDGAVLCLMHGGGWTNGYKEWMAFMAPGLTARGVTMVSIGYRLAPKHVFPDGLRDCMDAVALVYRRIAEWGGDPGRIFVGGHSAGGHLAALMALKTDWQEGRGLSPNVVKGALPISGTYLFGPESGLSMRPRFLGDPLLNNEFDASPMAHMRRNAPPFFITCGSEDFPHLSAQARDFADALEQRGNRVERMVLQGCDHLGASYTSGDPDGRWIAAAARFMGVHER